MSRPGTPDVGVAKYETRTRKPGGVKKWGGGGGGVGRRSGAKGQRDE